MAEMAEMADLSATGAALIAAGWSGRKLLGPLFDEIAEAWRDHYIERRRNLARVVNNAEAKVDRQMLVDGAWASPRVVARVVEAGSWCEAPVMAEYFGGILAASVSPDGADDRGLSWAALVAQLSSQDVFLHYLAYSSVRRLYLGREDVDLGWTASQEGCLVYLPVDELIAKMGVSGPFERAYGSLGSAMVALERTGLLGSVSAIADAERLSTQLGVTVPGAGVAFTPSTAGVELFLWAHGQADARWQDIIDPTLQLETLEDLPTIDRAIDLGRPRSTGQDPLHL